mmetsp:Transcript_28443/g.34550  ORF Transcript_28443/g.34550 Transcript_28443/m.34550 type:complete len:215 (+) Transcript_28443:2938-3582(+)
MRPPSTSVLRWDPSLFRSIKVCIESCAPSCIARNASAAAAATRRLPDRIRIAFIAMRGDIGTTCSFAFPHSCVALFLRFGMMPVVSGDGGVEGEDISVRLMGARVGTEIMSVLHFDIAACRCFTSLRDMIRLAMSLSDASTASAPAMHLAALDPSKPERCNVSIMILFSDSNCSTPTRSVASVPLLTTPHTAPQTPPAAASSTSQRGAAFSIKS